MDGALIEAAQQEAARHGIRPATLLAVIEVESGGEVFANVLGRREPLIRFEGHWFDRRLDGAAKARARLQGVAAPTAGTVRNPASQTGRWALLERAMKIDRAAALESTSWGIGQVMGGHWKWLGYSDVEALVAEARSGAAGQLRLMLTFIGKSGLLSALVLQSWSRFALGYNGPDAIRNGYDRKLAAAFDHWNTIDLRLTAPKPLEVQPPANLKRGTSGPGVTALQDLLTARGFPCVANGTFDEATEAAVRAFQTNAGLEVDGIAGTATLTALSAPTSGKAIWRALWDWLLPAHLKN